jgi:tripartite-type tricarboxylate transporter receptor subunit TctC
VLGNEIQLLFGSPTTVIAHIKAGRLRAVAYTGAQRLSAMPELPTVSESDIPGMVYEASWHGIFAPAATPRPVILRFQAEVAKAMQAPRLNQYITESGHAPGGGTPEEFRKFLVRYLEDTAEQLRIAGVKPE